MQNTRHLGEALPPGTAHLLPVLDRGRTGCSPGLCLGDLGRVCLGTFWPFLQVLLGLLEVPFGLLQTGVIALFPAQTC
jgi:hypothetical protein